MFTIYYALNKINGKAYVGKTNDLKRRIRQHRYSSKNTNHYFYKALRKYGESTFEFRVIDTASNEERASEFEKFYIQLFETYQRDRGYNLTMGGEGQSPTEETRRKLSLWQKGKAKSDEQKQRLRQLCVGRTHTDETKAKMRSAKLGKKKTPETIEKMKLAAQFKAKTMFTSEVKDKMSASAKNRIIRDGLDHHVRAGKAGAAARWNRATA